MRAVLVAGALALAPAAALAQHTGHTPAADAHAGHAAPADAGQEGHAANGAPSDSAAFAAVNAQMHAAMDVPLTGDVDVDFLAAMIPHHQGALEMAEIALAGAKDPEVRALAEAIVAAQRAEIAEMEAMLVRLRAR